MRQKLYLVTLSESVLVDTTVGVRADSEEAAARLALEGAHYDMEKWRNQYDCDPLVDTTICDVHLATERDVKYADQKHLLDRGHLPKSSSNEAHERAISKWREGEDWWAHWFEENSDYLSEL